MSSSPESRNLTKIAIELPQALFRRPSRHAVPDGWDATINPNQVHAGVLDRLRCSYLRPPFSCGSSCGLRRCSVNVFVQVADYSNAVTYLTSIPHVMQTRSRFVALTVQAVLSR